MIRAVIFDMDGVLIDARDWHYEALNRALALFGFSISRYDHLTTFDGLPTRRKLHMLSTTCGLPEELHDFINDMKQRYTLELVYTRCKPRFNHEYALSRLQARGVRLAVASNSIRATIETMMRYAALDRYLEFVVSNEDVARSKPDPEMYILAINRLGLSPEECLIVEDNENGIRAARASGAHVMVVRGVDDVTDALIGEQITRCDRANAA
jgi:HAD superfamily hydrolase (TIGR01509 family)